MTRVRVRPRLLLAIAAGCLSAAPASAKPTREAIVAYAKDCLEKKIDIDLIGKFGRDYRGMDLREIDLRGGSWNGQTVTTIWHGADLSGADLEGAMLRGVILDDANLSGANLKRASLGPALRNARLDDANLEEANLDGVDLSKSSLRRANLKKAEISAARFVGADLRDAVLRHVRCEWYPPVFENSNLTGVDFEGAEFLPEADFSNSDLTGANFRGAALVRANFRGADLSKTNLLDGNVQHALFENVRGISAAEQKELRRRAARWRYDLLVVGEGILRLSHVAAFFLAPMGAIVLGVRIRRQNSHPAQKVSATWALLFNGLAIIAFLSVFVVGFFGSRVAQFNAGNPLGMDAWSFWVGFWPVLMGMLWLTLGVTVIAFAAMLLSAVLVRSLRNRWRILACWMLTALHVGLQIHFVGMCFPTA
jgi:uncharacterized protein YjbI with pentapeptide repeats